MSKTWKNNELKISRTLNTERNPLSGSNSGHTTSDTLHDKFYIEIKDGKQSLPTKLWLDIVQKAKTENKTPMLIQHGKGERIKDSRISLRLGDFLELANLKGSGRATMNPHDPNASKINFKFASNKNRKVKK